MNISVFGSGYVGLTQAACLAEAGHQVLCMDIDSRRIARLAAAEVPFHEPGLQELVSQMVTQGRLRFSSDGAEAVAAAKLLFIAVGTPLGSDGRADLHALESVVHCIARHTPADSLRQVVSKSTAPPGTVARIRQLLQRLNPHARFQVAANPEFLKEGSALADFRAPERVIIGADDAPLRDSLKTLYRDFCDDPERLMCMDAASAELVKYASNCMLAVRISFINEIARIAELVGADTRQLRRGMGADSRIGPHFLQPGCGFGGSCLPKDVQALRQIGLDAGLPMTLLGATLTVNQQQREQLFSLIERHFGGRLQDLTIAVWGLAFKPNTDDIREAPSLALIELLMAAGAHIRAHDPAAMPAVARRFADDPRLQLCADPLSTLQQADALVLMTEWPEYAAIAPQSIARQLNQPVIFDGRCLFDAQAMHQADLLLYGTGRILQPAAPRIRPPDNAARLASLNH